MEIKKWGGPLLQVLRTEIKIQRLNALPCLLIQKWEIYESESLKNSVVCKSGASTNLAYHTISNLTDSNLGSLSLYEIHFFL